MIIRNCSQFMSLDGIKEFCSIERLTISNTGLSGCAELGQICGKDEKPPQLKYLKLTKNKKLKIIEGLNDHKRNLPLLTTLILRGNSIE